MAKKFARQFYNSKAWHDCRIAYIKHVHGLCEMCMERGEYVLGDELHHKEKLTPDNINDPSVSLNWDNLILLCRPCHQHQHDDDRRRRAPRRYIIDDYGRVQSLPDAPL